MAVKIKSETFQGNSKEVILNLSFFLSFWLYFIIAMILFILKSFHFLKFCYVSLNFLSVC